MSEQQIKYPAKVMLAGEYGVLLGGWALTIPFNHFSTWPDNTRDVRDDRLSEAMESNRQFREICKYLVSLPEGSFQASLNKELLEKSMEDIWYDSTIPDGYGIGSSGALSACIYKQFYKECEDLSPDEQRNDLAAIESYFHGKSSGVDALTSFRKTPLLFSDPGKIEEIELDMEKLPFGYKFFLVDSGVILETGPLVKFFLNQMENSGFASSIRYEYLPVNQKFIESLLGIRDADPGLLFRVISDFQYTHFRKMIPDTLLDDWIEGQVSNEFYFKLNGSGGGYILGLCHHSVKESIEERFINRLIWLT